MIAVWSMVTWDSAQQIIPEYLQIAGIAKVSELQEKMAESSVLRPQSRKPPQRRKAGSMQSREVLQSKRMDQQPGIPTERLAEPRTRRSQCRCVCMYARACVHACILEFAG